MLDDVLTFVRFLLYPLLSYALVTVAYSGENGGRSKFFVYHMLSALFFIVLWFATFLKIGGESVDAQRLVLNYALTPVLAVLCIYIWTYILSKARVYPKTLGDSHG